jgi:Ca-activated chloride channel family protein
MLSLAAPWWLLLLPLPWLLWRIAFKQQQGRSGNAAILHPQTELLMRLSNSTTQRPLPWLWLLGSALLLLALARPQWWDREQHEGRNFLLALDTSSSMRAQDFSENGQPVSRMQMVKRVVDNFISQRQGDHLGLLVFGDDAFTLAPLTSDIDLIRHHLKQVSDGVAGPKTALGQAIALGVQRLRNEDERSRILLLLTDGSNTAGSIHPLQALALAKANKVRIYTIGIGSNAQVMFSRGPVQKAQLASVPVDATLLQQLAQESGGRYYQTSTPGELDNIIADIEQLETIPLTDAQVQPYEWYSVPLLLGLGCLALAGWREQREVLP